MRQASKRIPDSAEKTVRDIRRATRRHHSAEEKIRIVLEGLRGENSIAELCRKELRSLLAPLRAAKNAPVRAGKMLPRSTIATVAVDILQTSQLVGHVPGDELIKLLKELLDVDKQKATADRQFAARYKASWMLAQDENIGTRELERIL